MDSPFAADILDSVSAVNQLQASFQMALRSD